MDQSDLIEDSFTIVGMRFHPGAQDRLDSLEPGTPLILKREPSNPYDENAIEVYHEADGLPPQKLGYVPRGKAEILAPMIDQGASGTCVLEFGNIARLVIQPAAQEADETEE